MGFDLFDLMISTGSDDDQLIDLGSDPEMQVQIFKKEELDELEKQEAVIRQLQVCEGLQNPNFT